ncbi:MAG: 1-acyl-sn-glycerol-3-phosphate acyltransferase [Planctomycetes bacterium]|nr:1-acyl-sn-glycerol-3-phosphate acyltransferase [Planctomycetota bacterium]
MSELPVTDGVYRTAPRRVSWLARTFPSLVFFLRLTFSVLRAAKKAKWSSYGGQDWVNSSLEVVQALESVGVEFEITGIDNLKKVDGPCLIVGNHMGTLETMVLPAVIQPIREVTFVVKLALVNYPVFKHVMRSRNPIAVTQTDPRADLKLMLKGGQERLANGVSLVVFPQGERSSEFDPSQFNSIGVKLAGRAKVPIIPLALQTDAWPVGSIISDVGTIDPSKKVRFAFGEPLRVEGRGTEENEAIVQFISEKLRQWQDVN